MDYKPRQPLLGRQWMCNICNGPLSTQATSCHLSPSSGCSQLSSFVQCWSVLPTSPLYSANQSKTLSFTSKTTNFTCSRCRTLLASLCSSLSALFPSVSASGKSSHLLNGRFCQLNHCNCPLLSRCHRKRHPMANSMSPPERVSPRDDRIRQSR